MKKFFSWLLIVAFLFQIVPCQLFAEETLQLKASGTIVAANIAVTLADGSADVDLSSATIPRNYRGYLLKIYDSSNRLLQGYVYTDGAGTIQNIVSAKGGTTRNWASQAAGFDDTTDCRYELWKENKMVEVATGSIPANEAKLDTTSDNAFAAPESSGVPIGLSAYQDGRHVLWLKDSSNNIAFGHIKGTAPGGETLAASLLLNGNMETGDPPTGWTATSSTVDGVADERTGGAGAQSIDILATGTYGRVLQANGTAAVVGALYKASVYNKNVSGGHGSMRLAFVSAFFQEKDYNNAVWTQEAGYCTSDNPNWSFYNYGCTDVYVAGDRQRYDDAALQRVTDCAATGALIVSTQGGATRAWTKNNITNPNLALTYKVFFIGDP